MSSSIEGQNWRRILEECFRHEAGPSASIPDDDTDLVDAGHLDSMAWVSFVRALESATRRPDLGQLLSERPASFSGILALLDDASSPSIQPLSFVLLRRDDSSLGPIIVAGSSSALGSHILKSEDVDRAFGMPAGKLRNRAGIISLAYSAENESEIELGAQAAQQAMAAADCHARDLDWIIATSETHRAYPSLAAQLHSRLLVRENCGALDVGGACLGLLNALATAQAFLVSGQARTILVVTADVHSRILAPGRVPGEFGGLFGDGASAFLLRQPQGKHSDGFRLGEFFFGCVGQHATAIRAGNLPDGKLELVFDGDALSRAAITRLEKVLTEVESRSGIPRNSAGGFATHQPNPRLVTLLAKQLGVARELFPPIAENVGNLGSSTCGAALHAALEHLQSSHNASSKPIFLASLGPGLLYGGGWLYHSSSPR
jgi:3-oxoacyl-[acyl-carrier-protein] synthase III